MRVLLTTHLFLPDYSAGTEVLTHSTARELRRRGLDVRILTGFPGPHSLEDESRFDSYEYDGFHVYRFKHAYVPMGGQLNLLEAEYNHHFAARKFVEILREFRPGVVHFFHLMRLSASLIGVCRSVHIPTVLTTTDFWFVCPMNQLRLPDNSPCTGPDRLGVNCLRHLVTLTQPERISSKINRLPLPVLAALISGCRAGFFGTNRYAQHVKALSERHDFLRLWINEVDRVLVPTRIMQRLLVENGLDPAKALFCPYGIDIPAPSDITGCRPEQVRGVLRVGFIGTLSEHKGAHVLVEAVRRLSGRALELRVYGRLEEYPDYVQHLRDQASEDSRIHFLGTFPNERISDIFAELDVLIVPSLWYENTPLVIYSAQARGCPVIATDLGGMSEAVAHEDNGLLFPIGNVEALASLVSRLLDEPELLPRLRKNARHPKTIAQYAEVCAGVYAELTERKATEGFGTPEFSA